MRDFTGLLADGYEMPAVFEDLVRSVSDVLSVPNVAVFLVGEEGLRFAKSVNSRASEWGYLQIDPRRGPSNDAHSGGAPVLVEDLSTDSRWPDFRRAALDSGIRAVAGIPLRLGALKMGSLGIYADSGREWSECDVEVTQLLADVAMAFAANASRLAEVRGSAQQLQTALDSRVIIEQAKGMLAGERHISVTAAFEILRGYARSHNVMLRWAAEEVVNGGLRP